MKIRIFLVLSLMVSQRAFALVSCTPTSCATHGCTYYSCSGSSTASVTFTQLPLNSPTIPNDACAFPSANPQNQIPSSIGGVAITQLPQTLTVTYNTCVTLTMP